MWAFFKHFFNHQEIKTAQSLYWSCVEAARQPFFYTDLGVKDAVDGRFDLVLVHTFLLVNRLSESQNYNRSLVEQICNLMIADFDRSLREMGVGDFGIGRKMRHIGEAYTGRFRIYQEAFSKLSLDYTAPLDWQPDDAVMPLVKAITRNVYRQDRDACPMAYPLAVYMQKQRHHLAQQPLKDLRMGQIDFLPVDTVVDLKTFDSVLHS